MDIETQPFYHEQYASFVDSSYVDFTINLKGGNRGVDYAAKENTHASAANYLNTYKDLDKKWRGTAWEHYSLHGKKEGRIWKVIPDIEQSEEAAQDYLANNEDVAKSWKGKPAYLHWLYYGQYETPARIWNANATSSSDTGTLSTAPIKVSATPAQVGGTVASLPTESDKTSETTDGTTTDGTTTSDGAKKKTTPSKPKWVIPAVVGGVLAVGTVIYFMKKKKSV